ncbi:MAG: CopD family protein [Pseudomonadota bacterium]
MLWVKTFHLVFLISWFAGLFYLPRLFVYHAMSDDEVSNERFKIMERKLLALMALAALLTTVFGLWMLYEYAWLAYSSMLWLHIKLLLVLVLFAYHGWCWKIYQDFKQDRNNKSHVFYRWFNEFPVLMLIAITILVIVKPF